MEIAALVDAGTKTSSGDWDVILSVVSAGAGHFMISPNCVRWAVVSYADTATQSITLTAHSSLTTLQPAIRALPLINGGSNLLSALQLLRSQVFTNSIIRTRATLVAWFVTDDLACSSQLVAEANNLKTLGVVIVGVVFTSRNTVDVNCVREIVTANMYYEVSDSFQASDAAIQAEEAARGVCPPNYWSKSSAT